MIEERYYLMLLCKKLGLPWHVFCDMYVSDAQHLAKLCAEAAPPVSEEDWGNG